MPPARKSTKSSKPSKSSKAPADQRIIDGFLAVAAEKGWVKTGLGDIAASAGVSLAELQSHYPSKAAILSAEFGHYVRGVVIDHRPALKFRLAW